MDAPQTETVGARFRERLMTIALAALVPIFTGGAYVTGVTYRDTYLSMFGVPSSLAPTSTAQHFVDAYITIKFLGWTILENPRVLMVIGGLTFLAVFQWLLMDEMAPRIPQSRLALFMRRWFSVSPRVKAIGRRFLAPAAVTTLVLYFIFGLMTILIVPVELGGAAGRMLAQEDLVAYHDGCKKPVGQRFCNRVIENDKQLAEGYIIGGTEKTVIVYDGTSTFILPRGDKTTITASTGGPKN